MGKIYYKDVSYGGGGSSTLDGSIVGVEQIQRSGNLIAVISVDEDDTNIYSPLPPLIDVDVNDISVLDPVTQTAKVYTHKSLTKAEYEAIPSSISHVSNIIYAITDEPKLYLNGVEYNGTGGGQTSVIVSPIATEGTKIASISVDGLINDIYTPEGGDEYVAGDNIIISTYSGQPSTISAVDTTYTNFTGASTTLAGTAGLVPAPTTADSSSFLCGNGTWSTVSAGGSTVTANPVAAATSTLTKLEVDGTVYAVEGGGSGGGTGTDKGYTKTLLWGTSTFTYPAIQITDATLSANIANFDAIQFICGWCGDNVEGFRYALIDAATLNTLDTATSLYSKQFIIALNPDANQWVRASKGSADNIIHFMYDGIAGIYAIYGIKINLGDTLDYYLKGGNIGQDTSGGSPAYSIIDLDKTMTEGLYIAIANDKTGGLGANPVTGTTWFTWASNTANLSLSINGLSFTLTSTTATCTHYTGSWRDIDLYIIKFNEDFHTTAGNAIGGASALADLTDVAISSATDGQALVYSTATSKWENAIIPSHETTITPISTVGTKIADFSVDGTTGSLFAPAGDITIENKYFLQNGNYMNEVCGSTYNWVHQTYNTYTQVEDSYIELASSQSTDCCQTYSTQLTVPKDQDKIIVEYEITDTTSYKEFIIGLIAYPSQWLGQWGAFPTYGMTSASAETLDIGTYTYEIDLTAYNADSTYMYLAIGCNGMTAHIKNIYTQKETRNIIPNPEGVPTSTLSTIEISNVIYELDKPYRELTQAEYDALYPPGSTVTDNILYAIKDGEGGSGGGGASDLDDLSDVDISHPSNGQVLTYDSNNQKWVNANASGGTTVVANPSGSATDNLLKLQVGNTIYNSALSYSTTEQVVGTWHDGREIYQKSYVMSNFRVNANVTFNHNISNLDQIISFEGSMKSTGDRGYITAFMPMEVTSTSTTLKIAKVMEEWYAQTYREWTFTIKYLKTSS